MTHRNEDLVRQAYQAYTHGDLAALLDLVHPELEWTFLDPAAENPEPATCHGRDQLRWALGRPARACGPNWKRSWPAATTCWS